MAPGDFSHSRAVAPAHHGGNWRAAAGRYGIDPAALLDFSANINPLGPPPAVLRAMRENLKAIERYPDPDSLAFRAALAAYLGVEPAQVVAGNGAIELLYLLLQILKPRRVLVAEPTFSEYRRAAALAGAGVETLILSPADGFTLDPRTYIDSLAGVDLAFLCNPNNPTGSLMPAAALAAILAAARRRGAFLVVDESFLDFVPGWPELTLSRAAGDGGLLVLRSQTKCFALPGLRLGAALTSAALAERLHLSRDPWSVNILAQIAGVVALQQADYLERTRALVAGEREFLSAGLAGLGVKPLPAAANFLLVDLAATGRTAADLAAALGRRGVLVRDCTAFPGLGPGYLRLAVKDRPANAQLLAMLSQVLT